MLSAFKRIPCVQAVGNKSYAFLHLKDPDPMSNFHYVYILVDEATGTHFYIGCTEDLKSRLEKHNKGDVPHTAKYKPWRIKNAIAFANKEKAYAFEAYLKTHCGRAFIKRHF